MSLSLRVDKPKMESDNCNMIRVKIIKKIDTGLGFLIQPRSEKPHVVISAIVSGGMAEKCGLIRIGDVIVRVNEMDLSDMVYEKCVDLLKSLPQETAVSLLLKGPDGYTSYLHTTFLENGTPHTIRITKPVANNESFVSRLRRTFGRSQSPSGRTPLRQSRSGNISPKRNKQKQEKEKIDTDQMDQTCFVCPVNHSSTSKVQNDAESQTDGENAKQVIPSVTANGGPLVIIRESKKTVNNNSLKNINNSEINNKVDTIDTNTVKNHSTDSQLNVIPNGRVNEAENLDERRDSKGIIVSPSMQRKEGMAHNSPAQQKRYVKLRNIADSKLVFTDTLHSKAIENVPCAHNRCLGSLMGTSVPGRAQGTVRPKEEMLVHAKDFFDQYFTSIKRQNTPAHQTRLSEVYSSIEKTGKYELTTSELTYGAKLAWRNAARCIGRIQWSKLQVFDARHITTARGMFEAICNHIKYATNKGNIRSAITVFPPRTDSKHDFRVWNTQLIMYAGYKQPDGSVIGDPASIDFTNVVIKMGWKPKFGMFDVLPLILQANGMDPEMFEIPAELIFEVPIKHPKFPSFAELGLKWFALPAVSAMLFDCGGLEFTACPFNGWYMGTEIASRDFLDAQRYNLIEKIAEKLGLDTRKNSSLWRDRVCVETNIAVLHSYQVAGATIMDHHAASESFMKFMENEMKQRGGCPADWVWVVPPLSSSITPVFHQEMLLYKLKPSYEYQDEVFRTYVWKKDREKGKTVEKRRRKFGFKELARAVKFSAKLMVKALSNRVKCTILYATETGKSERFAKTLCEIFKHAFDAKVVDMAEYDAIHLEHEALVLFITSTFGNGDPPENGEAFAKNLHDLNDVKSTKNGEGLSTQYFRMSTKSESEDNQQVEDKILEEVGPLSNVRFSVFGLGSRAYPNFCAFAHYIDNMMNALGSERIYKMGEPKFEISHFSVGQENLQNNKDEFRNLQTMLEHIENIMYSENKKGMLSDRKTEFEHTVQSTDIHVLQDYLHSLYNNDSEFWYDDEQLTYLFYLIVHHVLVASENENSTQILNVIKDILQQCDVYFYLDCTFQLYLDVYYKDNPNDIFTNIHSIWKCDKATELNLKLFYCKNLMEAKDYKTLLQLIHHHADNLIESFEEIEHELCNHPTANMVLLHVLHYQVLLNKMERVKIITTILSRLSMSIMLYDEHVLLDGFYYFILTLDNKQLLCIPYVIKLFHSLMKEQPLNYLCMILLSIDRLRQANHYTECIEFIKSYFQFISSFPTETLKIQGECYYRQQYCITLLFLLHEYASCNDNTKLNLVLTKLLELRVSFLPNVSSYSCYCFMGNHKCLTKRKEKVRGSILHRVPKHEFQCELLHCYQTRLHSIKRKKHSPFRGKGIWISHTGYVHKLNDFNSVMNGVIQGELELAPYLQSMIHIMSKNMYKDESVLFFIEFIERSTNENEESLYNILKMLCAFDLQPEVQDLILQGWNAYLMISCIRQYGILSKFILDINMLCPKDQFLLKLTSGISKTLLKFDNDTVKDFNNIIYKCYCTVRHDCRNEKDANIQKYKDHFTFIASMEAEEEMKKLTSLTNLLLMLTLLLIASGGHLKSAELKKYLSLKYEYRDSILYLLWCSGDVEINPGPTLSTLRKVPDSVKERNWIYEMCSMLLRLLKYKSIDIRIDGLWKEKPLDWPVDSLFYDPRNKPKGKGYSINTDRKLLENLEELCNGKKIFQDISQFQDEHTKSTVKQYQKEITAWKTNKADLFELFILRQELDVLLEAKKSLQKYKKEPELKEGLSVLNVDLIFDSEEDMCISNAGYTDIVRDIAITLCRTGKGLDPLEKSDGIWKKPPPGWCLTDEYFSPCNAGKRLGKCKDPCKKQRNCKDRKLVDHLLRCCETMVQEYCKVNEKPVLIKLLHAWKQENVQEVRKYHTIWSNMEVIDHSLKYLKLEGLLAKSQTHLEKLGIKPRATDSKENIQDLTDLSSCPIQGKQTNPKCPTIIQSHQDNHFDPISKLSDSDACEKVVLINSMGSEFQETDQTTQNKTNKRKHQSTDEKNTEPKKLNKSDKGKSLSIATSPTEQCHGEPTTTVVNDQIPLEIVDDIFDLQDEFNLNNNSSSFNIPSLKRISNGDTSHAVQQENVIEGIVAYLKK